MRSPSFEIDAGENAVQTITPGHAQRFEGIAFSSSGNVIGIATSDTNTVLLFRKKPDGRFESAPYWSIGSIDGRPSRMAYPHDVSFSLMRGTELLAVAQRGGAIAIYEKNRADERYGPDPVFEIIGERTKLQFSDGVAFVPPGNDCLAACNLESNSLSFYRRTSRAPLRFRLEPDFELAHPGLSHPDGLAFSSCGRWLAIANHGNNTVSIFRRRNRLLAGGKLRYGPEPVTVISDPGLRYPHSVAFTPATHHLVVTSAGANYFNVYRPERRSFRTNWSQTPVAQQIIGPDSAFMEVNMRNKMEGGPKGVAIHEGTLAICSPEHGVKIYSFREG
jgi:DNA-binding beta-propeller fold protein YncE